MTSGFLDYHTQTLEHGRGKSRRVLETLQWAAKVGLRGLCLTDHLPLPSDFLDPTPDTDCAMPASHYPEYLREVQEATAQFSGEVNVRFGAEVDWLPKYRDWSAAEIARYPFDYVLGSVHFVGEIEVNAKQENLIIDFDLDHLRAGRNYFGGMRPLVEAYYQEVRGMVTSGLFDGVGHLDLVKKFNPAEATHDNPKLFEESEEWYRRAVLETLDAIAASAMTMEINGAGLAKPCKELYPSQWIVDEAHRRGIRLTTGSDAHKPEDIGKNLDKAVAAAKAAGYGELVEYRGRERVVVRI